MQDHKKISGLAAVAIFALIVGGCQVTSDTNIKATVPVTNDTQQPASDATPSSTQPVAQPSSTPAIDVKAGVKVNVNTKKYKDGMYTAVGAYRSPAGAEQVNISLVLRDDVVTNATFSGTATNPVSVKMQGNFDAGFKEQVVGKSIDQINLTVVNGSSLTPKGFMDAVVKIKQQAAVQS